MSDELRYKVLRSGCEVPSSPELSEPTAKLILAALCDHADRNGIVFVGYRTLAVELGRSHSTTFAAYRLFEAHRVLIRTGQRKGTGGATVYKICLDSLTPTNPNYYLPTALSTQATSPSGSDLRSDPGSDPGSDPASCPTSDPTTQARSLSLSVSGSPQSEALFRQALELELQYRPSAKYSFEQLADMKRSEYLAVCDSVLAEFPGAEPPDRELALLVVSRLNPTIRELQITEASRRELDRRYRSRPATTEQRMTPEQIRELSKSSPLRSHRSRPFGKL